MNILKKHKIDLDQFAINLHFSNGLQRDFKEVCGITNFISQYVLRHCYWKLQLVCLV